MSVTEIYTAIKAKLPASLQKVFFLGERSLPQTAGPIRIVMVPTNDRYQGRARRGDTPNDPEEICSYEGLVEFFIIAPDFDSIDGRTGLRNRLLTICRTEFPASFTPESGDFNPSREAAQAIRGEFYLLRVRFGQPVVAIQPDDESAIDQTTQVIESTTITQEEAP